MILHFAFRYGVSATGEFFEPEGAVALTTGERERAWISHVTSRGEYLLFARGAREPVRSRITLMHWGSEEHCSVDEMHYPLLAGVLSRSPSLLWRPLPFRVEDEDEMGKVFRVYGGRKGIGGGRGPRAILGTLVREIAEGASLHMQKIVAEPLQDGNLHLRVNGALIGGHPAGTVAWLRAHERVASLPLPPLLDTRALEAELRTRMATTMAQEVDRTFMEAAGTGRYYAPGFTGPPLPPQMPPPPRIDFPILDDGKRRIRRRRGGA